MKNIMTKKYIKTIPFILTISSLSPSLYAGSKDFEVAADIGKNVLLLKADNGALCSSQFVKITPPLSCGKPQTSYKFLTADHCVRLFPQENKAAEKEPTTASILQVYKNIKSEESCLPNKNYKNAFLENEDEEFSTAADEGEVSIEADFIRLRRQLSPYAFNTENFSPILTVKLKNLPDATLFSLPTINTKQHFESPSLRKRSKNKNAKFSDAAPALYEFAATGDGSFQPTSINPLTLTTPLMRVSKANSNSCTDQLQLNAEAKWIEGAKVEALTLAAQIPALESNLSVMGYQFGCQPVKINCSYVGVSMTRLGAQHTLRCENLQSKVFQGLSGGAVMNDQGQLVGIISQYGKPNRKARNVSYFSFSPTLSSMISCDGQLQPPSGIITFEGFTDKGKVTKANVTAEFEETKGCYKNDSLRYASEQIIGDAEVPATNSDKNNGTNSPSGKQIEGTESFSSSSPNNKSESKENL